MQTQTLSTCRRNTCQDAGSCFLPRLQGAQASLKLDSAAHTSLWHGEFWKNPNFSKEAAEFQIQSPLSTPTDGQIEGGEADFSAMKASMRTEAGALFTACTLRRKHVWGGYTAPCWQIKTQRILLSTGMRLTHETERCFSLGWRRDAFRWESKG